MTKRTKKEAHSVMEELGFEAGHEHLDRDLKSMFGIFVHDGGARWRAFDAVALIVSATLSKYGKDGEEFDGLPPTSFIPIPWWAARALHRGWMDCRGGQKIRAEKITLGRAFEFEATKPGRQGSPFTQAGREDRDREITLMIARRLPSPKIELTITDVAVEAGLNDRQIWEIYRRYKEQIIAISKLLQ